MVTARKHVGGVHVKKKVVQVKKKAHVKKMQALPRLKQVLQV